MNLIPITVQPIVVIVGMMNNNAIFLMPCDIQNPIPQATPKNEIIAFRMTNTMDFICLDFYEVAFNLTEYEPN